MCCWDLWRRHSSLFPIIHWLSSTSMTRVLKALEQDEPPGLRVQGWDRFRLDQVHLLDLQTECIAIPVDLRPVLFADVCPNWMSSLFQLPLCLGGCYVGNHTCCTLCEFLWRQGMADIAFCFYWFILGPSTALVLAMVLLILKVMAVVFLNQEVKLIQVPGRQHAVFLGKK